MNQHESEADNSDDLRIVKACIERPSQLHWAEFFERFEDRFRRWIAIALLTGTEQDREDAYQSVVERILRGKVLPHINLGPESSPSAYLFKTVQNSARKAYRLKVRLAEEPLDDGNSVSSYLARLADEASPVQGEVVFQRLTRGLSESGLNEEKFKVFNAFLDCENVNEVIRKTRLKRATVYRYLRELAKLSHQVLGVPYEGGKKTSER